MKKYFVKFMSQLRHSTHDPSSDMTFLGVHSESIFPVMGVFFLKKLCFRWSPCLLLIAKSISLDTSGKPTVGFFLAITLLNDIVNLT